MEIAAQYLDKHECPLLPGPFQSDQGPKTGQQIRYFTSPWGMALEILHRPDHMPYEKETQSRLFGPLPGWGAAVDTAGLVEAGEHYRLKPQ